MTDAFGLAQYFFLETLSVLAVFCLPGNVKWVCGGVLTNMTVKQHEIFASQQLVPNVVIT